MKKQIWATKIAESSRARIVIFFLFAVLIGSFTFLAFRANANLAASRAFQTALAQQTDEIQAAGSMNDFYNKSWLANDQNFSELAGYVDRLVRLTDSQSLDPKFKQELSDYILKTRPRVSKEAIQIQSLSFPEGILRLHQSRLLEMYDELSLVFRNMEDIVSYWDVTTPQDREAQMSAMQDAFFTASMEFQATAISHRQILKYAGQLDVQSKQDYQAESDRILTDRTQFTLAIRGLIVSVPLFAGWVIFLVHTRRRNTDPPLPAEQKEGGK